MSGPGGKVTAGRDNRRRRPRGYAAWRPRAETRELLTHVAAVLDTYAEHLPLTVRQVFYRLVATAGYPKSEAAYARLCEHLVRARRARLVPFEALRDDGVVSYSPDFHAGVEDFWDDTGRRIRDYRRDRQAGQPVYLELWCEAAGMAPQLARVGDTFSVPVFSAGGFASLSAVREIAGRACKRSVPTLLLHVGDLDPSGASIFTSLAEDAAAFVQAERSIKSIGLEAARVALTPEQVAARGLPTAPAKSSDSRSARWRGGTCQAEALAPDELAGIVEGAIAERMHDAPFSRQLDAEEADRLALWRGLPAGDAS